MEKFFINWRNALQIGEIFHQLEKDFTNKGFTNLRKVLRIGEKTSHIRERFYKLENDNKN